MTDDAPPAARHRGGRPRSTTHAHLERVGMRLFTQQGFEATSIEDIAAAAGISRRTFFRYFASKTDVVWGDFDTAIARFRADLGGMPLALPLMEALMRAVVRFNTVPPEEAAHQRERLALILGVPELIARSTLRYAQWRRVVEEFAADRLGQEPEDLLPRTIGYCALGAAVAAHEQWLETDGAEIGPLLERAFHALAVGFEGDISARASA